MSLNDAIAKGFSIFIMVVNVFIASWPLPISRNAITDRMFISYDFCPLMESFSGDLNSGEEKSFYVQSQSLHSILNCKENPFFSVLWISKLSPLHERKTQIWLISYFNIQKFIKKKKLSWLVSISIRLTTDVFSFCKLADWFKSLILSSVSVGICVTVGDDNSAVAVVSLFCSERTVLLVEVYWFLAFFSFSFVSYFILFICHPKTNK